jgi:hypothetical protein
MTVYCQSVATGSTFVLKRAIFGIGCFGQITMRKADGR